MKHFLWLVTATITWLSVCTTADAEKTVILVVHQGMSDADQKAAMATGKDLILGCGVGDVVQFHNASTLRRIASATIPETTSQRARLVALRRELAALQGDLELRPVDGGAGAHQPANIPALLTSLRTDGKPTRIVVFSSLYFNDGSAASFSRGQYLSDGWILGTSRESVFGTSDLKGMLSGVFIDWVCTDAAIDTLERRTQVRYWTAWASELNAVLTSVENTASVAVENALKGLSSPVTTQTIDRADTAMEVRQFRAMPAARPTPAQPSPSAERLAATAAAVPAPRHGFANIFPVWTSDDGGADIDVWVKPAPSAAELNFSTTDTPEGKYLRDVQRSRQNLAATNWTAAWEGVQIPAALLPTTVVWLNVYKNPGKADVHGFVRVQCDGRSTDIPFRFTGVRGDEATGRGARQNNPCWINIDLGPFLNNQDPVVP